MQKIIAKCKECGKQYRVPRKLAGRRFKCKKCPAKVKVPLPEDSALESGDEEDVYENETEDSEETPVPPPTKKKKGKEKKEKKEKKDKEKKGGKPKRPISALVRRAKPGLAAQKRKLREGDPKALAEQKKQKTLLYAGVGIGLTFTLVVVLAFAFAASGPKPLSVREQNFYLTLNSSIVQGQKSRAEGQFLFAIEGYDKAVAHLEKPAFPLDRCPPKYEAVLSADLLKLQKERDELLEFMKLLEEVKGGDTKAMEQAASMAKAGEEYQRLSALLILAQKPEEEPCKLAIIELAQSGSGAIKEKAIEFLKTKIASKEAIPYLEKDIAADKETEKAVRLLMRIKDPDVAPILAKVLVKHVKNVPFTRDVLVELIGLQRQGMVDKASLADVKEFAGATENVKLRDHAQELIQSLEESKSG